MKQTISIIGCGWLGLPLAENLVTEGHVVKGSTTSTDKLPLLQQKGLEAVLLHLGPEPTGDMYSLLEADILIVNVPPKASKQGAAFHPTQMRHLVDFVRLSAVQHIIYVSSTSVYPEKSRVAVEEDVCLPDESAAPALVEAEQLIMKLSATRSVTILRCGGLMGYDRIPGKYVAGRTVDSGSVPVNYLHRDDAVGILSILVEQRLMGTFNAVAPEHPSREAVYRKSCADFGYDLPLFVEPSEPVSYKLISPAKLIRQMNYSFRYPDPLQFSYGL